MYTFGMILGFVIRSTQQFNNTRALTSLYTSLVRSILEYGAIIWNSSFVTMSTRIEAIQRKFLRYYFRKIKWPFDTSLPYWKNLINLPPYNERCKIAGLESLSDRRDNLCVQFISDILCGRIDNSELLSRLNLCVPSYSRRNYNPIYLESHRTTYMNNAPMHYNASKFNSKYSSFDYNLSKLQFKNTLKYIN